MKTRQIQILEILFQASGYVTTEKIAEALCCSERTIRNDIRQLKLALRELGQGSLTSKTNRGYYLELTSEEWTSLIQQLTTNQRQQLYSQDRGGKYPIIEMILKNGIVQITHLENKIYVSYKNAARCVEQAGAWLEQRHITLQKRRGQGVTIDADLHWIRLALWSLFSELTCCGSDDGTDQDAVCRFFDISDNHVVYKMIGRLEEKYKLRFSYEGYKRLVFLLTTILVDNRKKRRYHFPFESMPIDCLEHKMSIDCLQWMDETCKIAFSECDLDFIQFALASTEIMEFTLPQAEKAYADEKITVVQLVGSMLSMLGDILQTDFSSDEILQQGLLHYVSALSAEVQYGNCEGMTTERIPPDTHSDTYVACWSSSHLLEENLHMWVTEREIDAIAAHVASAVERKRISASAYIVCSYGVGTSQLLHEQIKHIFPNIHIIAVLTPRDIQTLQQNRKHYDFIITTVALPQKISGEIVRIGTCLQHTDVVKIQKVLGNLSGKRYLPQSPEPKPQAYSLFHEDAVLFLEGNWTKQDVLHKMCNLLCQRNCVNDAFEQSVLNRELDSSTILSSGVAIPHGFPELVNKPCIAVAFLQDPVAWTETEKADVIFLLALSMDARFKAKSRIVAFYKTLVQLLDQPQRFADFRALTKAAQVVQSLNDMMNPNS